MRCIFSPDDSSSCISCKRKGKACEEQRREHFPPPAGKKTSLKERVAKLEALLESSAIQVDDDLQTQGSVGGNEESPESPNSNGGSAAISSPTAETSMSMTSETSQRPGPELNPEFDPDPMVALFNNPIVRLSCPPMFGSLSLTVLFTVAIAWPTKESRSWRYLPDEHREPSCCETGPSA